MVGSAVGTRANEISNAAAMAASTTTTTSSEKFHHITSIFKACRYLILFFLFLLGIRTAVHTFLHRNQFGSTVTNTLCSRMDSTQTLYPFMYPRKTNSTTGPGSVLGTPMTSVWSKEQLSTFRDASICDLPPKYQFKKFIWFLTDGLPIKYSQKTLKHYGSNSILYTIDLPGPKYSHAIYTSYLTGQLPTNYQGHAIKGDSLIKSLQRSPEIGPLTYIGPEWSFLAISGKQTYQNLFKRIIDKPEPLDQPHDRAYRFFFENDSTKSWFWKTLNYIAAEGGSLFTHSAIFDHINHGVFRNTPTNTKYLDGLANRIADDLNTVKAWIDQNPDYLLILSSDHGVDDVSNGYVLHGYSTNGNEGYLMLYNPRLMPHKERIDVVDVAPTIAKYLDKVDIPADNIGITRVFYEPTPEGIRHKTNALKQNMIQLADTSKRRGVPNVKYDTLDNLLRMAPESLGHGNDGKSLNAELTKAMTSMKNNLYKLLDRPFHWVVFYGLQSFIVMMIILYRYNYNTLLLMAKGYVLKGVKLLLFLVPMYFGAFLNILFVWDSWKNIIRSGGPFYVWHALLALVVFYLLFRVGVTSDERDKRNVLRTGRQFLMHTLVDITWFTLFTLFRKQWKYLFEVKAFSLVPYGLLALYILISSNVTITSILLLPFRLVRKILRRPLVTPQSQSTVQPQRDYVNLVVSFLLLAILIAFELTSAKGTDKRAEKEKYIKYYNLGGFHFLFALFLAVNFTYFVATLLMGTQHLDRLVIPVTMYAFAIMRDTPHGRFLTTILNLQYYLLLVPLVQKVNIFASMHRRQVKRKLKNQPESSIVLAISNSHAWDLLQQALVLFALNQPLYQFVVGKEEKLNVDAHPFAGAIGMRSHQEYPSFNAFQMAFEKWHTIALFTLFLWKMVHKTPEDDMDTTGVAAATTTTTSTAMTTTTADVHQSSPQLSKSATPQRKLRLSHSDREQDKTYITDLVVTTNALLLFNANGFLQLMLCFIGMNHPFEDSVVYLIVMSLMGALFTLFHLTTQYFSLARIIEWVRSCRGDVPVGRGDHNTAKLMAKFSPVPKASLEKEASILPSIDSVVTSTLHSSASALNMSNRKMHHLDGKDH